VSAAESEHLVVLDQATLVGDVIAHHRNHAVGGEEQRAIVILEIAGCRVVLHQRRQPRLAEELTRRRRCPSEEPPDAHTQRSLVSQHPCVSGALQRRRVEAGLRHAGPRTHQVPPLFAEHLAGQHQPDAI
jgi:hypothetical protein